MSAVTDLHVARLRELVVARIGLVVPEQEEPTLRQILTDRPRLLRCVDASDYLHLLQVEWTPGREEWEELACLLTTGESYFFRDAGQFHLLREVILPEILARRRKERQLRIWSAGCSTGEEPYSLAMALDELIGDWTPWSLFLLASDINTRSLESARQGVYGKWSFRQVDPELIQRHFTRVKGGWRVNDAIRQRVVFRPLNLMQEPFPSAVTGLHGMDLIFCRNVFIYFQQETVARLADQFAHTLRPGGYLVTGHAELSGRTPAGLVARIHPQSILFRKPLEGEVRPPVHLPPAEAVPPPPAPSRPWKKAAAPPRPRPGRTLARLAEAERPAPRLLDLKAMLTQGEAMLQAGEYGELVQHLTPWAESAGGRDGHALHLLLARAEANRGATAAAVAHCQQASRLDPFAAAPHFLLAHLTLEAGDPRQARNHLQKTLYLDTGHVPAYLELASLLDREGERERARKMRLAALDVLRGLPPDTRVESYESLTLQELAQHVQTLLE